MMVRALPILFYPLCIILAFLILIFLSERRRLSLKNIRLAFPEYTFLKSLFLLYQSTFQVIEGFFLVLALPFLSKTTVKSWFKISGSNGDLPRDSAGARPVLWLVPHFCHTEILTAMPTFMPEKEKISTIYRPLNVNSFEVYLKKIRQRFGMKTINRKSGLLKIMRVMRSGETLAILFDQNAGKVGRMVKFFDRPCSSTTLPDILFKKYKPKVFIVYTRRTRFLRSEIKFEQIMPGAELSLIDYAHNWLEQQLLSDPLLRPSWLWLHDRWKIRGRKSNNRNDSNCLEESF